MYSNKDDSAVYMEIQEWIDNRSFSHFFDYVSSRVIGQTDLVTVIANIYSYLNCIVNNYKINHNMLLAAPSGTGKTETYRVIKDYFNMNIPSLPVYIQDMTSITATGYKGNDPDSILIPLENNNLSHPVGLVFLDEFDKIIQPSITSSGDNVNLQIQYHILTLVEGSSISVNCNKTKRIINTHELMFIGMGSFDYFRDKLEDDAKAVGFAVSEVSVDHFQEITRDTIIDAGGCYELLGRFQLIVNYNRLSQKSINMIINKIVLDLEDMYDCDIILKQSYQKKLYELANSNYGCRDIVSTLSESVIKLYGQSLLESNDQTSKKLVITFADDCTYTWRQMTKEELCQKYTCLDDIDDIDDIDSIDNNK